MYLVCLSQIELVINRNVWVVKTAIICQDVTIIIIIIINMPLGVCVCVRERERERERDSRYRPWIIFHFSSTSSNTCFLTGPVFTTVHLGSNCSLFRRMLQPTSQLSSSSEWSLYFRLVSEGGTYSFPVVPHMRRRFGISAFFRVKNFFLVIINSPVTSWPTTSALAWLIQVSNPFRRLSVCFFFFFFLISLIPQKLVPHSPSHFDSLHRPLNHENLTPSNFLFLPLFFRRIKPRFSVLACEMNGLIFCFYSLNSIQIFVSNSG